MNVRRHGTTLALVALALGLGAYAFHQRDAITDTERSARANNVFPAHRREDIRRVTLDRPGERIAFERFQDDRGTPLWRMTSPVREVADVAAVDRLVRDLEFATFVRRAPADTSDLGFDAPRVSGVLEMGAITYRFALGREAKAPDGAAYLKLDGEGAFVVSSDLAQSLLAPSDVYREREFLPQGALADVSDGNLRRIVVRPTRQNEALELSRAADGSFRLGGAGRCSEAGGFRANRATIDELLNKLALFRAERFVPIATAEAALASGDAEPLEIRIEGRDAPTALRLSPRCPDGQGTADAALLVGPSSDASERRAACIPHAAYDAWAGALAMCASADARRSLVDHRLLHARADEIVELRVEGEASGGPFDVARKGGGYRLREPGDRDLAPDEVEAMAAYLSRLASAEATDLRRAPPPGFVKAGALVATAAGDGAASRVERLDVGAIEGDGAWLFRPSDGAYLRIDRALRLALEPSATHVRPLRLLPVGVEERALSRLALACDGLRQELLREGDRYVLRAPAGHAPDVATALRYVDALVHARVERWLAPSELEARPIGPGCRVELGFEGDAPATFAIAFGSATGDFVAAQRAGEPFVGLVPRGLREAAAEPLIARAFLPDGATLERADVACEGRSTVYSRGARGLEPADDAGAADALATLRAYRVLHLGPPRAKEGLFAPRLTVHLRAALDGGRTVERHLSVGAPIPPTRGSAAREGYFSRLREVDATFALDRASAEALCPPLAPADSR
jgi:hypothetical protein